MQCNATTEHVIIHLSKFPLYELGNYNMVFEVELELTIDEEDGATVGKRRKNDGNRFRL
jgi:hypothetical protein